jgi:hypothetical protein
MLLVWKFGNNKTILHRLHITATLITTRCKRRWVKIKLHSHTNKATILPLNIFLQDSTSHAQKMYVIHKHTLGIQYTKYHKRKLVIHWLNNKYVHCPSLLSNWKFTFLLNTQQLKIYIFTEHSATENLHFYWTLNNWKFTFLLNTQQLKIYIFTER